MASQMFGRLRTQAALLLFCGMIDSTVQDAAEEAAKLLPLLLLDKLISLQVPTEIIRIIVVIVV
jgi:hypothetical protein